MVPKHHQPDSHGGTPIAGWLKKMENAIVKWMILGK
jgi:hypothetical protein